jgi:hypothetical protein
MPTIPTVGPPVPAARAEDDDDFSLAFAAGALLVTAVVLAVLVLAVWLLVTSVRGGS